MTASSHLCVADCIARGRHLPDCEDQERCFGCLPRLAADGVRLCAWHTEKIADDATQLAELHAEIGLRLANSGTAGEKTSGTKDPGLLLNDRAVEIRTEIRHVLVSWSLLITEERGIQPPPDDTRSIGAFITRHAQWLAAHPAAADASNELRDLTRRAWGVAYPSGSRVFEVSHCPEPGCSGTIKAIVRRTDSLLPSSLVCDLDEEHQWPANEWLTLGRKLRRAA